MAEILQFKNTQPIRAIARPTQVQLTEEAFIEEVPQKRCQAADPIKNVEDIIRVQEYLIDKKRYRDNLLFICGVNLGLRAGDLLRLKVGHLLASDGQSYNLKAVIQEEKTNKVRTFFLNDSIMDAADMYFADLQAKGDPISLNDYLFKSRSNNRSKGIRDEDGNVVEYQSVSNEPIDLRSVDRILKDVINKQCGIDVHASTHCLRKTFGYHMVMSNPVVDRNRAVSMLQKIFNHSSETITLRYIGLTDEEIKNAYQNLNLGQTKGYNWKLSAGSLADRKVASANRKAAPADQKAAM